MPGVSLVSGNSEYETNPQSVGYVGYVAELDELLERLRRWYGTYIKFSNDDDVDILSLWTVHTYLCDELYYTPRLLIDSPMPGSGKTTLLEHLDKLCFNPVLAASVSQAVLGRITARGITTLLLDEADRTLDPTRPGVNDLIAVINGGYKKGASRRVSAKGQGGNWVDQDLPLFSPVALAGNTPKIPADTRSRCIVIRLLPDRAGTISPSEWRYIEDEAKALAEKIQATADKIREQARLLDIRPKLPKGCNNRMSERWQPLRIIAELADPYWANRVDELINRDIEAEKELADNPDIQLSPSQQVMKDLYSIFEFETETLTTDLVVQKLIRLNPAIWSSQSGYGKDLTRQRLGRILTSAYGIGAKRFNANQRGYYRAQFESVWAAYGITEVIQNKPTTPTTPTQETEGDLF
jgi:hypothetical protein